MSLSKPQNPVFIAGVTLPATESVGMLDANENATRVNQLHGIASNNALGAGIPKQVSNVQASVANAQTGATCTVTVLYRQDPTDKNFAGVNVWVKGYQGNNQLVRVASGVGSPTKFVLNNTGEIVSFTVQAYGNGGSAPLTGSPTCSGNLPQSKGGGFGSSSSAPSVELQTNFADNASQTLLNIEAPDSSAVVSNPAGGNVAIQGTQFGTVSPAWWGSGDGSPHAFTPSASGQWGTGTANQLKVWLVRVPYTISIKKLTARTVGSLAASTSSFGVYNLAGTTKLIAWEGFATNTVGVTLTKTLGATVILTPGLYYVVCACDTTGAAPLTLGGYNAGGTNEGVLPWNTNGTTRTGTAANAMVATVLPATLGALSPGGGGFTALPLVIMEP